MEEQRYLTCVVEIDTVILSYLEGEDFLSFITTCRYTSSLLCSDRLWSRKIDNRLSSFPIPSNYRGKEQQLYFILHYLEFCPFNIIDWATGGGYLPILHWVAKEEEIYPTKEAVTIACLCGRLDVLEWINNQLDLLPTRVDVIAVFAFGHFGVIKWLSTKGIEIEPVNLYSLLSINSLHIADWVVDNSDVKPDKHMCELLSTSGKLEQLKWIHHRFPEIFVGQHCIDEATKWGVTNVVEWLIELGFRPNRVQMGTCIKRGKWDTIKLLDTKRIPYPIHNVLAKVAEDEDLTMFQWCCHRECDQSVFDAFGHAMEQGSLKLVTWSMDNFPIDRLLMEIPESPSGTYNARMGFVKDIAGEHTDVVDYICRRLGPRPPVEHRKEMGGHSGSLILTGIIMVDIVTLGYLEDDVLYPLLLTCKYTQFVAHGVTLWLQKIRIALPRFPFPFSLLASSKDLYNDLKSSNFSVDKIARWAIPLEFLPLVKWLVKTHGVVVRDYVDLIYPGTGRKMREYVCGFLE